MKLSVKSMCLCSLFAVLIGIGAFIKLPISIVPVTLQTLFVVLAGMLMKKKVAMISVLLYVGIGLIGIPVFANGGGISYVLQPSFGYLLGFIIAAYFVGWLSEGKKHFLPLLFSSMIGMLMIYLVGVIYFALLQHYVYHIDYSIGWLLYYLFLVYLPGDFISCLVATWIAIRIKNTSILDE